VPTKVGNGRKRTKKNEEGQRGSSVDGRGGEGSDFQVSKEKNHPGVDALNPKTKQEKTRNKEGIPKYVCFILEKRKVL